MADFSKLSLGRVLGVVLGVIALSGCDEAPKQRPLSFNELPGGRYKIVHIQATGDTIEIDTASGKTWLLERDPGEEGGGLSGWRPIEDLR